MLIGFREIGLNKVYVTESNLMIQKDQEFTELYSGSFLDVVIDDKFCILLTDKNELHILS